MDGEGTRVSDKSGTLILTAPAAPIEKPRERGDACIVLLHPPGPEIGKRTPLKEAAYIVGRDNDADLVISRSSVSRQHSRLSIGDDGEWTLADLGSTNGTFVNEEKIQVRKLLDG